MLALALLAPLLMIGLRYQVGGDWDVYLWIYNEIEALGFRQALGAGGGDAGYSALNWLASAVGAEVWAVNLICGALFSWGLFLFCKEQPNPWLAALVAVPYLVIVVAMGYSRQAVAIGMVMAAIIAWNKGQLARFGSYILIAAIFHKTAVVILPLIALSSSRHRLITAVAVLTFGLLLYNTFLSASVERLVTNYVDTAYTSEGAAIRVAMNIVPALLFLSLAKRFDLTAQEERLWRFVSLAALGTLMLLLTVASSTVVDRLALYLIPLQLFVFSRLPTVLGEPGRPNGQILLVVIAYSALLQFVWLNYANHAEWWLPFQLWPLDGANTEPEGVLY